MKTLLRGLLLFFILTLPVFWNTNSTGLLNNSIDKQIESQITPKSSTRKIKKLQTLFKELGLYLWKIDWNYDSIKKSLIDYQIKVWLVKNEKDWWAGFFGMKTIKYLKRDFKDKFEASAKKNLKMVEPEKWKRTFIITAYYSPLKWQRRYTTWSYYWDIRLNWWWHTTASWKKVFPWLLAAPKNYKFWTKIFLEWIWVWSVEDRWWAIVNAWDRWHTSDRIDVWMWYWDEWLARALKWWKREVKWEILWSDNFASNVEFKNSPAYKYQTLLVTSKSSKQDVIKLQTLFKNINTYNGPLDWKYSSIKDDLIWFQLKNKIIKTRYQFYAWLFWPKWLAAIRRRYFKEIFIYSKIKNPNFNTFWLSFMQMHNLEKIKTTINNYFDKKVSKDKKGIYLSRLKKKLAMLISKQIDPLKKKQLTYLQYII